MQISLTAVLEDGTPRRGLVPADPRQTLRIPQGSDVILVVSVVTPGGNPVDLTGAGTELLLSIKKNPKLWHDSWPRVTKKATLGTNVGTFLLEPGDTHGWLAGLYAWDVWLTKNGSRDAVIPTSPLQLLQSVAPVPERPPPPTLELVANDTEPMILDFSGVDITGWAIEAHIGYPTPFVKVAVLTDPTHGLAEVLWDVGDLQAGIWSGEIKITKPGSIVQTSDEYIFDIRQSVTGATYLYYGAAVLGVLDEAFIKALAGQPLSSSRQALFTVTAGPSEYICYAAPITYGTPTFVVDGFVGGFSLVATVSVTNLTGTQMYGLWQSDYPNLGLTSVRVM